MKHVIKKFYIDIQVRFLLPVLFNSILFSTVYAGSVPNIFWPGAPAKSTEVNNNFSYLANRCWDLSGTNLYYKGGNVGIGTDNPWATLTVSGEGRVSIAHPGNGVDTAMVQLIDSGNKNATWNLVNRDNDNKFALQTSGGGSTGYRFPFVVEFGAPTRSLSVKSNGNVGVGINNPVKSLHVKSQDSTVVAIERSSNDLHSVSEYIPNGELTDTNKLWDAGLHAKRNNYEIWSWNGKTATPGLAITNTGNVGIGTGNPTSKLHIIQDTAGPMATFRNNAAFADVTIGADGRNAYVMGGGAKGAGDTLTLGTNMNSAITIDLTGNVGINTVSPRGKLDVNGAIFQRGVSLHADYVFEPNYQLEPIEEHAVFMLKNKHLKSVPKAVTDETGQDIVEYGSHLKGILEELEKAHVYIAQLNETIKSQNQQLQNQQTTISALSQKMMIVVGQLEAMKQGIGFSNVVSMKSLTKR